MKYLELCKAYKELEENPSRLKKTEILSEFLKLLKHDKNKETVYLLKGRIFPDYDTREVGISTQLAVKAMSKSTGISEKEIIKLWKKTGDLGEIAEEISKKKRQSSLFSTELTVKKVLENLQKLPSLEGKGTVEKKMGLISELLVSANPLETKYIIRTLLSDLRIGVGEGVLRDAIVWACLDKEKKEDFILVQEAYDTTTDFAEVFEKACKSRSALENLELSPGKPLKVMLAQKAESIADGFEAVGRPAACFPKGEVIFSNPSIRNIESLKEKEKVIGSDGKFQKVLKVFERTYSGKVIKIYPSYLFPFVLTPEHRLLSIKNQKCSWKNRKVICRPNCQEQKYGCQRNYKNYKPEWIEAGKLEKGDFVLFPKFKEAKAGETIDLQCFNKDKETETIKDKIRSFSRINGTFKGKRINRLIKLSDGFFELMGWYLAEGSFDRSGIKFSLGYKEIKEAERIKELIKDTFDIDAKISKRKSVIEIKAHCSLLTPFFRESFGNYSTNKKIPEFVLYASPEKIKHFIRSYIRGDGHKFKETYTIVTASKNIAYQMILLLSKIRILPSVGKYENKGFGDTIYRITLFGKQINNIEENSHKTKTDHQRFFEDKNFFYIPIRKIEFQNYDGNVFNLETEDNTYLSSAIVHNCEYKYDGFRMLINKNKNGEIKIFTRRLEEVTKQFPEVEEYVKKHVKGNSFIIDSEAVGFSPKTHKYRPFQEISQRIKRKYEIEKVQKELPVEINVFDVLYHDGKSMISEPFLKRRKLLEKIIKPEKYKLVLAKQIITDSEEKAQKFYEEALKEGEEGVMIKSLSSPYKPGARVGHMLKLKPSANELDLVIVKAEYGTGKRGGWLTSYTVACKRDNEFLEIGKVSTGLKEKASEGLSFEEVSSRLKKLIIKEKGREVEVKPEIVITVSYQDIQKSPSYSSGFALRFPRFKVIREDRSMKDIATIEEVERDYEKHWKWRVV